MAAAIYEGADAVMLSAESAAGDYPIEAVTTMDNVAREVEDDPTYWQVMVASRGGDRASSADAIVAAAREIAEATDIKAICCHSQSGTTARLIARERPRPPVIAMTHVRETARQLSLTWGSALRGNEPARAVQAGRGQCRARRPLRWVRRRG